ncbi:hypothetical protein [Limnobacter sp.]|uniref:hypothetical protein n=1 Tax=Limnobacter sp. TaxID=2003368 RepID=UPI00311E04BB
MAIKTQIRLSQLTGSFGTSSGQINDQTAAAATGSIDSADVSSVLSHVVSALKRIHGEDSFSQNAAGEFAHSIMPSTADGAALGGASNEWSDMYLADGAIINLGNDQDVTLTHVADTGVLLNSSRQLQFGDSATHIKQVADGQLELEADTSIQLDSAIVDFEDDGVVLQFGADDDVTLTHIPDSALRLNTTMGLQFRDAAIFLNSSADGTLDIEADSQINLGTDTSGVAITIGHTTSEVTVADNLTVTGDLTVNGTTTTVNSTTLTVDDAIILLGQGNNANIKDLGLILERGGNNIALFLDETDDVFKFGFTAETASDDEITVADGLLKVQVDKLQITGSSHYISYENLGGGDYFNIATAGNMLISAETGLIVFTDPSAQTSNGASFVIDMTTDREASFKSDDEQNVFFKLDSANTRIDISSGLHIRNGGSSTGGVITFLEDSDNGSNISVLRGPSSLADNNTVFELPSDNGTNGYVLQTNGSGVTSWAAQGGAGNSVKTFATVAATISSNSNLSSDSGYSTTDYSAISTANASKAIDVYVNGQLLQSGSGPYSTDVSDVGFTSGDYLADTNNMNALDVKFAFALEADDVVCIIGRA